MKSLRDRRGGFTLIELMIVVAIIGILAAIAIPNFLRFQLRAKSSEGKTNLAAIRTAQEGYYAEFNTYVPAGTTPAALPGSSKVVWPNPSVGCPNCFDTVGWAPEGDVFFQYNVVAVATGAATAPNVYTASAIANIDGDNPATIQIWGYVKPDSQGNNGQASALLGVPGGACAATGTWNHSANPPAANLLETVGPCDAQSGQSVF
jgi:type IV pilus assembly protein PilA